MDHIEEVFIRSKFTLKYPECWTPLDWNDEIKYLSMVEIESKVIFHEPERQ
ncbi:hypothetical protein O3Q51_09595 [Cryomorphaceae bacterium 1068]|nr:hypothetical protein [Cryomorphaceae bacterium 1068]